MSHALVEVFPSELSRNVLEGIFWPTAMQFGRNMVFPDEVLAYLSMFMLNRSQKNSVS